MLKQYLDNKDLGMVLIRFGLGLLFLYGGAGKLFGVLGGPGLEAFSGMVWGSLFVAALVGIVELLAGIGLLVGFMVRESGLLLSIVMLVAIVHVHINDPIMTILIRLALLTTLLGLAFTGGGKTALQKD